MNDTATNNCPITGYNEKSRIFSWLSPLDLWKRHSDLAATRSGSVGDWVLMTLGFQAWCQDANHQQGHPILLCHGVPGAGKTFLCPLVIDTLCHEAAGQNIAVACLYGDYRRPNKQISGAILGGVLWQLVERLPDIPEERHKAFLGAEGNAGGCISELSEIIKLLSRVLANFQRTFIYVDALDEISVDGRVEFLQVLSKIVETSLNTRLFFTGRPDVRCELEAHLSWTLSAISVQPSLNYIERYLAVKLDNDPHPGAVDASLGSEILARVAQGLSEM
ncbi:hypothetical protein L873DRAFT_1671849 [Choiromyces venosus 120613-1]|uniref:Nephrocystin 3-like N-terminal domain-containing protein n=1 Tax=Choiromyces venosus 120613-1 TaxID=1336337 RepID=A0A3N4K0A0_9PEZI|nr:hypothetical protein L873DRAFT_1671849 [Choiromyces venosus 120613-1]